MDTQFRVPPSLDLKGRKLLVVDDDRINLRILGGILRTEEYTIVEADSGEKAIELYEKERPDIVLLDVMLPGIDGFATCRTLKSLYGEACSPIIFITAKNEQDDVVEGLAAGGSDYLQKPFRDKEVAARIRTHLSNRLLAAQRESLVRQLSEANLQKNRFLGMAAHDLRNPLASIRGLAEFLRDGVVGPLNPEQLDLAQTIHGASVSMLALVNDLLDVATIEAGQLKVEKRTIDLGEILTRAVTVANMEGATKGTRIEVTQREGSAQLAGDGDKLRQVIDNLLSNATKYSPRGSVIAVELAAEGGRLRLSVKDQGPGIPASERGRLFKDFGTLSSKPTGGEKSTGLGLAICRKIVEAHDGQISAENLPVRGCEFRVLLPFK